MLPFRKWETIRCSGKWPNSTDCFSRWCGFSEKIKAYMAIGCDAELERKQNIAPKAVKKDSKTV